MNAEFVEDGRFRRGMLVLLDHTDLGVGDLNASDVRAIADDFGRHAPELESTVVAIVAPRPTQFGLARMSTLIAEPTSSNVRVFYTRAEALDWLRQVRDGRADPTT